MLHSLRNGNGHRLNFKDDTPVLSDVSADRIGDVAWDTVEDHCSLCGADEAKANDADDDANEEKDLNHR